MNSTHNEVLLDMDGQSRQHSGRVYVIDDEQDILDVVSIQLTQQRFDVLTFRDSEEFLQQASVFRPGVVVTDFRMPSASGLDIVARLAPYSHRFAFLMLTGCADTRVVVKAMKLGATAVLDKPFQREVLEEAVEFAFNKLQRSAARSAGLPPPFDSVRTYLDLLSPRERDVAFGVYKGANNVRIGADLGISVRTVEKHRQRAMCKMQIDSHAGLIRLVGRELQKVDRMRLSRIENS